MIVRELLTRLGFAVNDSQLKKYERGTQNIKQAADGAAESFRNMFLAFASGAALNQLSRTADMMQSLEARVGLLPQTVGDVGDAFDRVTARASAARQSVEGYVTLYTRIGHATKEYIKTEEEALQITDTVSKALIVGGASAQESASVTLQLAQALGSGVLQGQEFNAMAEGAPQLLDALAEAMGHPRDQLKKLASEGVITTRALIEGFQKIGTAFDDQFMNMPMTIGQATTIVANRWGVFLNRMNRESHAVRSIAQAFLDGFDAIEDGLEKLIKFFGGATPTLKFFGIALAAALAPLALKLMAGAVMFLLSPLGLLIGALTLAGIALEDVYTWMNGGNSVIGRFLGDFATVEERFKGIGVATKLLAVAFGLLAAPILAIFFPIWGIVAGIAALAAGAYVLLTDWDEIMGLIKDTAIDSWNSISDKFLGMVDKIKGYWNSFKSFFGMGVSTTIDTATAAGAATAGGGVPTSATGGTANITINQQLPPGSPPEVQQAAYKGTMQASKELDLVARQAGQLQ